MKIYNKDKTEIIVNPDLSKGYLKKDIIVNHIKASEGVKEVFHYEVIKQFPNGGKSVKKVVDVQGKPAVKEEWVNEDILVYIPYTPEELEQNRLNKLRQERTILLQAFDKWEKAVLRGRELDDTNVMAWFNMLLDLQESAFSQIPERINYYMVN